MDEFKAILKHSGMSLVEAMIGLAIAGGISLVLMRQQETSSKMQSKNTSDQVINQAVQIIQTSLANRAICTESLKGRGIGDIVPKLVDAKINPNDYNSFIVSGIAIVDPSTMFPGDVKIEEMRIIEFEESPGVKHDYLSVVFNPDPRGVKKYFGGRKIGKKFRLQGLKDANQKYISCYSETSNLLETALIQACTSLDATWNPNTKKCELTNLPNCITTTEACRGRYSVNRGTKNLITGAYKCTQGYEREFFTCGQKTFTRDCYCGGTSYPPCDSNNRCDTGRVGCYHRTSMSCVLLTPGFSVNNCCQN